MFNRTILSDMNKTVQADCHQLGNTCLNVNLHSIEVTIYLGDELRCGDWRGVLTSPNAPTLDCDCNHLRDLDYQFPGKLGTPQRPTHSQKKTFRHASLRPLPNFHTAKTTLFNQLNLSHTSSQTRSVGTNSVEIDYDGKSSYQPLIIIVVLIGLGSVIVPLYQQIPTKDLGNNIQLS